MVSSLARETGRTSENSAVFSRSSRAAISFPHKTAAIAPIRPKYVNIAPKKPLRVVRLKALILSESSNALGMLSKIARLAGLSAKAANFATAMIISKARLPPQMSSDLRPRFSSWKKITIVFPF